jgi:hypothetical protein
VVSLAVASTAAPRSGAVPPGAAPAQGPCNEGNKLLQDRPARRDARSLRYLNSSVGSSRTLSLCRQYSVEG